MLKDKSILGNFDLGKEKPDCYEDINDGEAETFSGGRFAWSSNGPIAGKVCTQIHESRDPHSWNDNYLCSNQDEGVRWSSNGSIGGTRCIAINEPREPASTTWSDNYLCVPPSSPIYFRWSSNGSIGGMQCIAINESREPASTTWFDNYLCWS